MYKLIFIFLVALSFYGCTEETKKEKKSSSSSKVVATDFSMQNEAISFISNQENPAMYGSIKLNQLLNKAYYNSEVSKSSLLKSAMAKDVINEVERIKSYINTAMPIYYSIDIKSASPMPVVEVVAFGGINNREAILKEMKKANPDLSSQKHGNFELMEQPGVAMAMTKDKFVFSFNSNLRSDGNTVSKFKKYFKSFKGKPDARVKEVIENSKDVTMTYDFGNLSKVLSDYIAEADIPDFNPNVLSSMEWLEEFDMTSSMNLAFEDGAISLSVDMYGSDEMKETVGKLMGSGSKETIQKMGRGKPFAGLLASINVAEYQKMIYEMYPDGIINSLMDMNLGDEFESQIPSELSTLEATLRKDGFESFIGGDLGMMLYNIPSNIDEIVPELSVYFNIGENLKQLIEENELPDTQKDNIKIDVQNDQINIYSKNHAPNGKGPELSGKLSHIGNAPFSGFIDLDQIPTNNLPREVRDFKSIFDMLDFVDMEMDANGGRITLHMKDKSKNALTQLMDEALEVGMQLFTEGLFL